MGNIWSKKIFPQKRSDDDEDDERNKQVGRGAPIRLISFENFIANNEMPRYPNNANMTVSLSDVDSEHSLIIFLSHCWLRGWNGAEDWDPETCPHPDTKDHAKYKLCVEAIHKMKHFLAPTIEKCYIWCDFGCINQDGSPCAELKQLDEIIKCCDVILTPIHDFQPESWNLVATKEGLFHDYQAQGWNVTDHSYLNRGWCRLEMFYASAIPPAEQSIHKAKLYFEHGLQASILTGRRPHLLYGTKESMSNMNPRQLPPLHNSYFDKYHPSKGKLSVASDTTKITELVNELLPYLSEDNLNIKKQYVGERQNGLREGIGNCYYPDGGVYEGAWMNDKRHGRGTYIYPDGNIFVGAWENDTRNGKGIFTYADGSIYEGFFVDNLRQGKGTFQYSSGNTYCGEWHHHKMHGHGELKLADGTTSVGMWKDGIIVES